MISDTRLENNAPRTGSVTLFDIVNAVPAPYKNMHVVALRQFCMLLAQKPCMASMQIQAMFGTYDPAEYQWPPARSPRVIFVGCITNKHVHELADNSAAAQHDHLMAHHVSDVCVYVSLGHGLSAVTGIASP
jgi:hypothetical protein